MSGGEKGIKILHVDDERDFLAVTKLLLERENENFSINTAIAAEEGLELLNGSKYDVVISDYKMPGMDGLEFLQNIRQSGSTIPFIMFTGKGREEVAVEALNNGANYYLQKGGDIKSMYETLAHATKEVVDKKRAEAKLAEVEKERQIILDSTPAMMFWIDIKGKFIAVNESFATVHHKSPDDIAGKSLFDLYPEDMARKYQTDNVKIMESGTPKIDIEELVETPAGMMWVRTDKVAHRDESGDIIGIIGFSVDITEQKRVEEELKESRKFLETVIENIPDTITLKDSKHRFVFVNSAYCNLTGFSKDEVIGKTVLWEKDKAVLQTGEVLNIPERTYTDIEGDQHHISVKKAPLIDESGKITHVLTISRDITGRKRFEEQITKLNECFLNLGTDYLNNIEMIVDTAGEILGGACMLYNRLEKERGLLCTWAIWHEPDGYNPEDNPEGHICYDVIKTGGREPIIIEDLTGTIYGTTDPNVRKYKLKSYISYPVWLNGAVVGSFCLCDARKRKFTTDEIKIIGMLGKAVAIEEERGIAEKKIKKSEEKYSSLINDAIGSLSSGIFILDSDFKVVWINKAIEEFFGIDKNSIIGCDSRKAIKERLKYVFEQPERFEHSVLETYDDNTYVEQHFECHVLPHENRKERFLEHRSTPIKSGALAGGWIEHYYDITELKRGEDELRKTIAELEQFNRLAVDRELRMIELKHEVNRLCERLGEKPPYDLSFVDNKITNEESRGKKYE